MRPDLRAKRSQGRRQRALVVPRSGRLSERGSLALRVGTLPIMAPDWSMWAHLMCSTRGAWLPGDERGFRSWRHKIHSSGDYKHAPPVEEHAGLRRHAKAISRPVVRLPPDLRRDIALAMAAKFTALATRPWVIAVAETHVHALARVGGGDAKRTMGKVKQAASHTVRDRAPGRIWGQGSHVVRVRDEVHFQAIELYIARHEVTESAWIWADPEARERLARACRADASRFGGRGDPDLRLRSDPASGEWSDA